MEMYRVHCFLLMGTVLRQMLCITKVPDETLRLANWVDVYVQNQIVFLIIIFVYGILIQQLIQLCYCSGEKHRD